MLDPLGLLLLWTVLLVLLARRLPRSRAMAIGLFALWYAGLAVVPAPAIVKPLVASLENEVDTADCPAGTPIVVLDGGVDGREGDAERFEAMSSATLARVAEGGRLALAEPGQRVLVSGGALGSLAEADVMASLLRRLGVADETILREPRSISTADNAREISALLGEASEVRLVTSALHVPRAVAAFEAAGLVPCAVSVDRIASADVPRWALWPQTTALVKFDRWLHEPLAMALYRLRGDA